ncbi:MAG: phosphatidylinositol-specific phospholipase C1-like protein [Pseudomonadales bacterium]|nr:phosphatidylinositol-specific phospholipase C1-like protein [Pseudomonadales bacterium]
MTTFNSLLTRLLLLSITAGAALLTNVAAQSCSDPVALEGQCAIDASHLQMNDLQTIGSHNSYKLAIPPAELELIHGYNERSALTLDYSHLPLTQQLDMGMRQIELDIFYDPEGGRFSRPLLPQQTAGKPGTSAFDASELSAPGFKVLHSQDIDVRSNCMTWIACLEEIREWSKANPQHVPILIMFNAKEGGSAYPGVTPALDFTVTAYENLDAEILSVFNPSDLITPDEVRGDYPSLREGVLNGGWPALDAARGRVFFAMDERPEKVQMYMRGKKSLQGLPIFVNSVNEEADHAAYFTINDPVGSFERIQKAVKAGFIVRTRADANTIEARENDPSRREAAFATGAQYISTDYYLPRADFSPYQVQLPGNVIARCNPVRTASCQ